MLDDTKNRIKEALHQRHFKGIIPLGINFINDKFLVINREQIRIIIKVIILDSMSNPESILSKRHQDLIEFKKYGEYSEAALYLINLDSSPMEDFFKTL